MLKRIPSRKFYGQSMNSMFSSIFVQAGTQDKILDDLGYTGRRVLGFKLPIWQRKFEWSDEKCVRFIESAWLGVGIGSYMVNFSTIGRDDVHMVLLDGQQRLRSVERYWNNEIAVVGDDGNAYYWGDLTDSEQAQFLRIPFPWILTEYKTDEELVSAYNRHNFGGVAHRADQMA